MKKLWFIFAQTTTIGLALWFLVSALKPQWFTPPAAPKPVPVVVQERPAPTASQIATLSYSRAVKRAMPAVVNIYTAKEIRQRRSPLYNDPMFRRFFGDESGQKSTSLGSGVIVSQDGYIVTNNHVVESADAIEVGLSDGRTAEARVIGTDPDTDLAVIRINLDKLPVMQFSRAENTQIGDVVLAIGNPFGVGQTVTMGIVSALGRSELGINTFENFIQTDAAINPGNSGGALIDTNGNLLGINSAIYSKTGGSLGIGFAIPVDTVKQVMDAIIKDGAVTRGWLGVESQEITPELASSFHIKPAHGTLIVGVVRGSPADRAGVRPGDVLIAFDDNDVSNPSAMLNLIAASKPGQNSQMRILRHGQEQTLDVVMGKRPKINNR